MEKKRQEQISCVFNANDDYFESVATKAEMLMQSFSALYSCCWTESSAFFDCCLWNGENCESFTLLCLGMRSSRFRFTYLEAARIAKNWLLVAAGLAVLGYTALAR